MSAAILAKHRLLVVGSALAELVRQAMPQAAVEAAALDALDALTIRRAAADLVLIDADTGESGQLRQLIEALGQLPNAPAVLLAGSQFPGGIARALFQLERADVLDAPFTTEELVISVTI